MSELGPHGRALLDAARGADDDEMIDARDRMRGVLAKRLGAAALTVTAATTATTASAASSGFALGAFGKLVIGLVTLSAIGGGVAIARRTPPREANVAVAANPVTHANPAVQAAATTATTAIAPTTATTAIAPTTATTNAAAATNVAPTAATTNEAKTPATANVSPTTHAPKPTISLLDQEIAALRTANQKLVAGQPVEALVVLNAAPQTGSLNEERTALRAIARCTLGQPGAKEAARSFLDAHPSSPLAARLRTACGL